MTVRTEKIANFVAAQFLVIVLASDDLRGVHGSKQLAQEQHYENGDPNHGSWEADCRKTDSANVTYRRFPVGRRYVPFSAAWAAASRAMGTRNGEQLT